MISISSWMFMAGLVLAAGMRFGASVVLLYYGAPLFVFASFLVLVTFLHHNDEKTPWYGDSEWTYVKGNLSSVDRSYGWLINNLSHNIGTHQIHHLFPIIPHYKLVRASDAFRTAFPHLVRESKERILTSFVKTACLYAEHGTVADGANYFTLEEQAAKMKKHS